MSKVHPTPRKYLPIFNRYHHLTHYYQTLNISAFVFAHICFHFVIHYTSLSDIVIKLLNHAYQKCLQMLPFHRRIYYYLLIITFITMFCFLIISHCSCTQLSSFTSIVFILYMNFSNKQYISLNID